MIDAKIRVFEPVYRDRGEEGEGRAWGTAKVQRSNARVDPKGRYKPTTLLVNALVAKEQAMKSGSLYRSQVKQTL